MSPVLRLTVCCLMAAGLVLSQEDGDQLPAGHEEILSYPYSDTFSCEGQGYGYYADVDSGCEVRDVILDYRRSGSVFRSSTSACPSRTTTATS